MESGVIPIEDLAGGMHLGYTLESGQSYCWRRRDGAMYEQSDPPASVWYETVVDGEYVAVRQRDGELEWESTTDAVPILRRLLRLDDDLDRIAETFPSDPVVRDAFQAYRGMRLVRDPVFPCLISFICSTQMRVPRIHGMQCRLAETFGPQLEVDGRQINGFPSPGTLAAVSEAELRELNLGYRAPYVRETAAQVRDGLDPAAAGELPYPEARSHLMQFHGVGPKVADCVLLFGLGFTQAVPLDTWIRQAIGTHFPECECGTYEETSAAIRERLGGAYAGYAQTYVFHYLRQRA